MRSLLCAIPNEGVQDEKCIDRYFRHWPKHSCSAGKPRHHIHQKLLKTDVDTLSQVPGFAECRANAIILAAQALLKDSTIAKAKKDKAKKDKKGEKNKEKKGKSAKKSKKDRKDKKKKK